MKKDPAVFIGHILESIELIEKYSRGMTLEKLRRSQGKQDSIIRRLEIIGEAVKNLSTSFRTKHPEVPWKKMAGMRDMLIHEYFDVDLSLTWSVVKNELPRIKKQLEAIFPDLPKNSFSHRQQ